MRIFFSYHSFDASCRAEGMANHRFNRGDLQLVGVVSEDGFDSLRLDLIIELRRGAVGVDVADVLHPKSYLAVQCAVDNSILTVGATLPSFNAISMQRLKPLPSGAGAVI